jgi:hypothetical protein
LIAAVRDLAVIDRVEVHAQHYRGVCVLDGAASLTPETLPIVNRRSARVLLAIRDLAHRRSQDLPRPVDGRQLDLGARAPHAVGAQLGLVRFSSVLYEPTKDSASASSPSPTLPIDASTAD